jgi:hypothetical protein
MAWWAPGKRLQIESLKKGNKFTIDFDGETVEEVGACSQITNIHEQIESLVI